MSTIMSKNEYTTRIAVISDELRALKDDAPDSVKEMTQNYVETALAYIAELERHINDHVEFTE